MTFVNSLQSHFLFAKYTFFKRFLASLRYKTSKFFDVHGASGVRLPLHVFRQSSHASFCYLLPSKPHADEFVSLEK